MILFQQMWEMFRGLKEYEAFVLDTTGQAAEESAAPAGERFQAGLHIL